MDNNQKFNIIRCAITCSHLILEDQIECIDFLNELEERNTPILPEVRKREYQIEQYFCPVCKKQQKISWKNFDKGCYCERCGQMLKGFREETTNEKGQSDSKR